MPKRTDFDHRATYVLIALNLYLGLWVGRFRFFQHLPAWISAIVVLAAVAGIWRFRSKARGEWLAVATAEMIGAGIAGGVLIRLLLNAYAPPGGVHGGDFSYGLIGMFSFFFVLFGCLLIGMKGMQHAQGDRQSFRDELKDEMLYRRFDKWEETEPGPADGPDQEPTRRD